MWTNRILKGKEKASFGVKQTWVSVTTPAQVTCHLGSSVWAQVARSVNGESHFPQQWRYELVTFSNSLVYTVWARASLPSQPRASRESLDTRLHSPIFQPRLPLLFSSASAQSQTVAELQDHQNPSSPILLPCLSSAPAKVYSLTYSANISWVPSACQHGAGCWEYGDERLPTLKELTSAFLVRSACLREGTQGGVRVDRIIIVFTV